MPTTPPDFRSDGSTPPRRLRGRKRPAQVMQPPAGNTGCGVERRLRFRPAAKGRSALAGRQVPASHIGARPGDAESGSWSAWQVSSRSPENAERSNLHRLLAMRLLGIARTASKLAKWLRFLERAKGFEPSTPTLARSCSTPELHPRPNSGRPHGAAGRSSTYAKTTQPLQPSRPP